MKLCLYYHQGLYTWTPSLRTLFVYTEFTKKCLQRFSDCPPLCDCSTFFLLVHFSALGWVYTQLLHLCNHRHDPVQPWMFHTLEAEVAFPSSHAYLISCKEAWQETHAALTHLSCRSQHLGGLRYSPALQYQPGQKIWLSSWDLPLQVDFRKLLACWLLWE